MRLVPVGRSKNTGRKQGRAGVRLQNMMGSQLITAKHLSAGVKKDLRIKARDAKGARHAHDRYLIISSSAVHCPNQEYESMM